MHYVAVRDVGDLTGKPMKADYVNADSDRKMVWACSTLAGALFWAHARLGQHDPKSVMHIYEAILDQGTLCPDPNYEQMTSSVMAASGYFGRLIASFSTQEDVLVAIAGYRGEDPYVDRMLAVERPTVGELHP